MIGIVDYGAGNLLSVAKAFEYTGSDVYIIEKERDFQKVSKIVIPGVGSFGNAMKNMKSSGLAGPVTEWVSRGDPVLGICLGMQMFFETSQESQGVEGFGFIKGSCRKFTSGKVPNIGWLETSFRNDGRTGWFYFVHSYFAVPENVSCISSTAVYGIPFTASVECRNVTGFQFHPEKSGRDGLELLKEWGSGK